MIKLICVKIFTFAAFVFFSFNAFCQDNQNKLPLDFYNYTKLSSNITKLEIVRNPTPLTDAFEVLTKLPEANEIGRVDLRYKNLSALDLSKQVGALKTVQFMSKTVWPTDQQKMPRGFNPKEILEWGKDPGLKISKLHKKGITGKGVSIAIIDQAPLVEHVEYNKNLKMYEELRWYNPTYNSTATLHGCAVASIAVGKNVGVAPDASLYYIAAWNVNSDGVIDYNPIAESIERIITINKTLAADKKIKVISIQRGFLPTDVGYTAVMSAIEDAKKEKIFVVSSSLLKTYGFYVQGLDRVELKDVDDYKNYKAGIFWSYGDEAEVKRIEGSQFVLFPMDKRTTASETGSEDYTYWSDGAFSWLIPYVAGVYVLAAQVKSDITPEEFWSAALNTGNRFGSETSKAVIINPVELIKSLEKK